MMAIRWRIRELMGRKYTQTGEKETYEKIAGITRISPNTLSGLATGKAQQVGVGTIERLLEYFDCEPGDLIVRVKETTNEPINSSS